MVSFLSSYSSGPLPGHISAAKYVLRYVNSTVDHGISFHSANATPLQSFIHFSFAHDREAYSDATGPLPHDTHLLTSYTDACWGSQVNNSVPDGTEIPLWKYRSMSGFIIMRMGGPVAWKALRQNQCSRSSTQAEVLASDECSKGTKSLRLKCRDLSLKDYDAPTPMNNDNQASIKWSKNSVSKNMKYLDIREIAVKEDIINKDVTMHFIPGKINPANIFTKEMKDGKHFRTIRDSFMMSLKSFIALQLNVNPQAGSCSQFQLHLKFHNKSLLPTIR